MLLITVGDNFTFVVTLTGRGGRFGSTPGLFVGIGFWNESNLKIASVDSITQTRIIGRTYWQLLQFTIDFDDNIRREVVFLFARSFQQTKSQLHLHNVLHFVAVARVSIHSDLGRLCRCQRKLVRILLHALRCRCGYERGWLQKHSKYIKKCQFLQTNIRMYGQIWRKTLDGRIAADHAICVRQYAVVAARRDHSEIWLIHCTVVYWLVRAIIRWLSELNVVVVGGRELLILIQIWRDRRWW